MTRINTLILLLPPPPPPLLFHHRIPHWPHPITRPVIANSVHTRRHSGRRHQHHFPRNRCSWSSNVPSAVMIHEPPPSSHLSSSLRIIYTAAVSSCSMFYLHQTHVTNMGPNFLATLQFHVHLSGLELTATTYSRDWETKTTWST